MNGYVKLHRQIYDHPLFKADPVSRYVFIELFTNAAWEETTQDWRGNPVKLQRGQIMISVAKLSEMTGFSEKQVRTAMTKLGRYECVEVGKQKGKAPSIITVCNYDKFQGLPEVKGEANDNDWANPRANKIRKEEKKIYAHTRAPTRVEGSAEDEMRAALTVQYSEPEVEIVGNQIVLKGETKRHWLQRFRNDEQRLADALGQAMGYIQPHGFKSVEVQVNAQLHHIAGRIADGDHRYRQAAQAKSTQNQFAAKERAADDALLASVQKFAAGKKPLRMANG